MPADATARVTMPVAIPQRRLHPAYLLISAGRALRSAIPFVAVSLWWLPWWVLAVVGALLVAIAIASWWSTTYEVGGDILRVRSGVLRRTVDTIPISRITALDARRGVVQRVFGVWEVRVQTPGDGEGSTATLTCLTERSLAELRAALAQGRADAIHPAADAGGAAPLAMLSTRMLLLATVTGVSIPLLLAGAGVAWSRLRDVIGDDRMRSIDQALLGRGSGPIVILVGLALLALLIGTVLAALRLARFTLVRDGDRLRTTRGLLSQRSDTILVDRVQAIRIVEGFWRRMLGYCSLEAEVAGIRDGTTDRALFPLLRTATAERLVALALPELRWVTTPLRPVPRRARRRYFTAPVAVAAVLTAALLLVLHGWWMALAGVPIPAAALVAAAQARDTGWAVDAATVTIRWRRVLSRHTVIARVRRVQLTRTGASVFARRAGLATLAVALSSGRSASARHIEARDAAALQHRIGRREAVRAAAAGRG